MWIFFFQALFSNNLWIIGHQWCEKCGDKSCHDSQNMRWCWCFRCCIFGLSPFTSFLLIYLIFILVLVFFTSSCTSNLSHFVDSCILFIIIVTLSEKSVVVQVKDDAKSSRKCKSESRKKISEFEVKLWSKQDKYTWQETSRNKRQKIKPKL